MAVFLFTAGSSGAQNSSDNVVAPGSKAPGIPDRSVDVDKNVKVSDQVRRKWRAIVLRVRDKTERRESSHTVAVGDEYRLPQTNIAIRAECFVPHFEMNRREIFSASDNLVNPAARVAIDEGGKAAFRGWLFQKFRSLRPFEHPRYEITLVEGVSSSEPAVSRSAVPVANRRTPEVPGRPRDRDKHLVDSGKRETVARYRELARALHDEGGEKEYDKAIEIYNRILSIDPGDKDALEGVRRAKNAKGAEDRLRDQ